ncbi:MAG: tripartite tricarboxylate transporter substrate binding protein [Variovorax sp.]
MPQINPRAAMTAIAISSLIGLCADAADAQSTYPSRPVTLVLTQGPGSQADLLARVLAEQMGKSLQQTFIIDNRAGASGTIGVSAVKRAAPDGYTLGYGSQGAFSIQPHLHKSMPYDVADFDFVCQTNIINLVVVAGPKSPFHSMKELVDAARNAPDTITLGSVGVGSGPHLIGEAIALEAGVKFNHIPFSKIGDLNTQLMAGNIDFTVTTPTLIAGNKAVRPLAAIASQKLTSNPDVPLLQDLGFKRTPLPGFIGMYAPKGIPAEALTRLSQTCADAVKSDAYRTASEGTSSPVQYADPAQYALTVKQDVGQMGELIRALGIKPE